jgi:hypothetical protein
MEDTAAPVVMSLTRLQTLQAAVESALGARVKKLVADRGELTLTVSQEDYLASLTFAVSITPATKTKTGTACAFAWCRICCQSAKTGACA